MQIEEFYVIATSVVVAADEPGIFRNVDALLPQQCAYFRPVSHGGKKPSIRSAATPPTGPTVMSRFVGIVEACRSVAQHHYDRGETVDQAGRTQNARSAPP